MAVKRRKPKAVRKEDSIRIRVTAEQKQLLADAAAHEGLGVSSWLLTIGLKEARKGEQERGKEKSPGA